ncbi:YraN family protein [Jannaschia sp. Os4]|nr:YraN family protein [Jannaschia sp. Os4]
MTIERRRARGSRSWHAGRSAEAQVARHLERRGWAPLAARWRGAGGEIDLVLRDGGTTVFVEVKAGPDHASAAARVSPRQVARLMDAAGEFMGTLPDGLLSDVRFDVALVDGQGRIEVIENALAG